MTRADSRFPRFYTLSQKERLDAIVDRGLLTREDAELLRGTPALDAATADSMIENVIGTFELPIGVGLNFVVDDVPRVMPMVVEEPSIVAAVSHIAKIVGNCGGFRTKVDEPIMIGQVQIVGLDDIEEATSILAAHADELVAIANKREPGMKRRGGGALGIETRALVPAENSGKRHSMLILHLLVDTREAMGANVVNTMCEAISPRIEELTGGTVFLRILSNLADRRRVQASCSIPVEELEWKGFSGEEVARGVEQASRFAESDPYRAATHNKGIMNGIDAVAIATGQDWRAIEAGAHAWAAHSGVYSPLAVWRFDGKSLNGHIDLPMAIGVVGGPIRLHPTVRVLLKMMGVTSAAQLASSLASVGLAQNLGALKALATQGIQQGHMSLHARSVAATAGVPAPLVDKVAQALIEAEDIKVDRARQILAEVDPSRGIAAPTDPEAD